MLDVLNLALPYFGLIFIGFACGKWKRLPDHGLAWMNFFILYVALPALFFHILSKTPLEQLAQGKFINATVLATFSAFVMAMLAALLIYRGRLDQATLAGVAGAFGNVGYMGLGLALATIGPTATVPVALIFSFDAMLVFALVPLLMSMSGSGRTRIAHALVQALTGVLLNPLLIAAALGVIAATTQLKVPLALERLLQFLYVSAAPCALFALGVTMALRPMGHVPREVLVLIAIKLIVHPIIVVAFLIGFGPFDKAWAQTAVLMAALPPTLTVYVLARQYDIWIEQASSLVLLGTALSVIILTGAMWIVQTDLLGHVTGGHRGH